MHQSIDLVELSWNIIFSREKKIKKPCFKSQIRSLRSIINRYDNKYAHDNLDQILAKTWQKKYFGHKTNLLVIILIWFENLNLILNFAYRKTTLLVPGVGHFSTANKKLLGKLCDKNQNRFWIIIRFSIKWDTDSKFLEDLS